MQAKAPAQRLDSAADVHDLPVPNQPVPNLNGHLPAFDYQPRTRVVFGPGKIAELGMLAAELGAHRVLLVTDQGLETAGHPQKGIAALESAGLSVARFDDVRPNPTTDDVARGLAIAQAARIDLIVGLGGGSSMDCAKGINFLLTNGGRIEDYWGANKARLPMLPMIAVPTTSGTGSEAQSYALIAHPQSHMKMACGDPKAACRIALLDPGLTVSMPASVTAATGIDALSHAVESYVSTRRNPVSQLFSRQAWQLLARGFPRVVAQSDDLDARAQMLLGAHLAGAAIENSMLGAAHALANPLSAHFGVTHGVAIAVMLPHVIRYNAESAAKLYNELAVDAGLCDAGSHDAAEPRAAALVAAHLTTLAQRAGLPIRLADCGVDRAKFGQMAAEAAQQWTGKFNPRAVGEHSLRELYEGAM
jgi:alcohol dehydrogenase